MRKSLIIVASLLLCFVFTTALLAQKGNKPPAAGCGTDVSVTLTVSPGYSIASDGGTYVSGGTKGKQISSVFQVGNCTYDFILNLNSSPRYLLVTVPGYGTYYAKFFNSDRIASVPITTDTAAMADFCAANADGSYKYDNYAGCGSDEKGAYVRRNIGFDLGDNVHNLRFQYSPIDNPAGNPNVVGTSFIKVYHPDANTWILEPEGTQTGVFLTNATPTALVNVPFSFVVKK